MFDSAARFVKEHQKYPTKAISVHGQESVNDTSRLARLNLAVHGLSGEIKQGNTYYEDLQDSVGRFDFVNIVEAPDELTMARVPLELGSRGTARY